MIKNSIVVAIVLFLIHLLIVIVVPDSGGIMGQKDSNIVVVQRYLYNKKHYKYVSVGSSMTEKIISDSIPDFYNLGLLSSCALDGIHYILMKPDDELPDIVYVEINNAHSNTLNLSLLKSFDSGVLSFLRCNIPSFRDEYKPVTMLKSNIINFFAKKETSFVEVDTVTLKSAIEYMNKDGWLKWGYHLDYNGCIEGFCMLKNSIEELKARGVKVVFFMVPMNKVIEKGPKMSDLVRNVHLFFPDSIYCYMPVDSTEYPTSDGIHLDDSSARAFTSFFKNNILDDANNVD